MGQQLRELTPHVSALHFFGAELRHHRQLAGLSMRGLAPHVLVSPSQVGPVEAAQRFPSLDLAQRCDRVLNTGGLLTRLHPLVLAERVVRPAEVEAAVLGPQEVRALLRLLVAASDLAPLARSSPTANLVAHIDHVLNTADLHAPAQPAARRRP